MTYTSLPFMACKEICLLSWVEKNVKINLSIWIEVRLDEYWLKSSASSCVRLVQWIILYKICLKVLKINFFSYSSSIHITSCYFLGDSFHLYFIKGKQKLNTPKITTFPLISFSILSPRDLLTSFPFGSPFILTVVSPTFIWIRYLLPLSFPSDITCAKADQSFSVCFFFSSFCPSSAAEGLHLIFHFYYFMYNAVGPFIKVKKCLSEQRAGQRFRIKKKHWGVGQLRDELSDLHWTKISLLFLIIWTWGWIFLQQIHNIWNINQHFLCNVKLILVYMFEYV